MKKFLRILTLALALTVALSFVLVANAEESEPVTLYFFDTYGDLANGAYMHYSIHDIPWQDWRTEREIVSLGGGWYQVDLPASLGPDDNVSTRMIMVTNGGWNDAEATEWVLWSCWAPDATNPRDIYFVADRDNIAEGAAVKERTWTTSFAAEEEAMRYAAEIKATTLYFFDTYGDLAGGAYMHYSIHDIPWQDWRTEREIVSLGDGWYQVDLPSPLGPDNYASTRMIMVTNGGWNDAEATEWVLWSCWAPDATNPGDIYFVADRDNITEGAAVKERTWTTSFAAKAAAESYAANLNTGGAPVDPPPDPPPAQPDPPPPNPSTGNNSYIVIIFALFGVTTLAAVFLLTKKLKT